MEVKPFLRAVYSCPRCRWSRSSNLENTTIATNQILNLTNLPVRRHVADGGLDDVVTGYEQLAVSHDLVKALFFEVHYNLGGRKIETIDNQEMSLRWWRG